ncbi:MAG: calcium-binding protein [Pseudomonadota bacterium]
MAHINASAATTDVNFHLSLSDDPNDSLSGINSDGSVGWLRDNSDFGGDISAWRAMGTEFEVNELTIKGVVSKVEIDLRNDGDTDVIISDLNTALFYVVFDKYGVTSRPLSDDDIFTGSAFDDTFVGAAGDDALKGLGGDDVLYGADGDDTLIGGEGNDTLYGAGFLIDETGLGRDSLIGGAGDDWLSAQASFSVDGFFGSTLDGGLGDDRLLAGEGDDSLEGGDGDDYLSSGDGFDFLSGGDGNDTLLTGSGDDTVFGDNTLLGGNGADSLQGDVGQDLLNGGPGNDTLTGENGADILKGAGGHDRLNGGAGNDNLSGGNGADTLKGGGGSDQFIFDRDEIEGSETVSDFIQGEDVLELRDLNSTLDEFSELIAVAAQIGDDTVIDFGDGATITLTGVNRDSLTVDDILFTTSS